MNTKTSKRKTVTFTLRYSEELHRALEKKAVENKRSIAKQVEFMLEQALKKEN